MATGEEGYLERYLSRRVLNAGYVKAKKGFLGAHKKGLIFLAQLIVVALAIAFFVWNTSYLASTPKCERLGTCVVGSQK